MILTILQGLLSIGSGIASTAYILTSLTYILAVIAFIIYALWLVVDDVNFRYCIFGSWREHRLYTEDAQDIFWSESLYACHSDKKITFYGSYIKSRSMRELELSAIEFGRIHHPNLKTYLCIENGQGYIRYREEMTTREIRESSIDDAEVQNTPFGE